ncbi:hypothetical protein QQ045_009360 [Rhodiola kirilowii]
MCLFVMTGLLLSAMAAHGRDKITALFLFGDSLFDPGNNQYLNSTSEQGTATTWPYGQTYFKRATGRLSDGRIVPDFVAQFAGLPILPPYLQPVTKNLTLGTNFASAGAGILSQTNRGTISLREQLSYFKDVEKKLKDQMGAAATKKLLMDAVYLFSIGGNDYFSFYTSHSKATQPQKHAIVASVTGNLSQILQVYDIGGRKIGFQNVGALGCLPMMKAMNGKTTNECISGPCELARLHNQALAKVLKNLEAKNSGFNHSIFNYYDAIYQRTTYPSKYGFKNGDDAMLWTYELWQKWDKKLPTLNKACCSIEDDGTLGAAIGVSSPPRLSAADLRFLLAVVLAGMEATVGEGLGEVRRGLGAAGSGGVRRNRGGGGIVRVVVWIGGTSNGGGMVRWCLVEDRRWSGSSGYSVLV